MIHFLSALSAFFLSLLLSRYLSNPSSRLYVLDHPNHRSLHNEPRPRNGGLAILAGFSLGWFIAWGPEDHGFAGGDFLCYGLLAAVAISFFDDRYSLPPLLRFLIQTCAAILLLGGGFSLSVLVVPGIGKISLVWFSVPFSILFVVWMMNLYNFMDGMDGFAGGMGAFGFGFLAILGWLAGDTFFYGTALVIAAANAGFLTRNFPAPGPDIYGGCGGLYPWDFWLQVSPSGASGTAYLTYGLLCLFSHRSSSMPPSLFSKEG